MHLRSASPYTVRRWINRRLFGKSWSTLTRRPGQASQDDAGPAEGAPAWGPACPLGAHLRGELGFPPQPQVRVWIWSQRAHGCQRGCTCCHCKTSEAATGPRPQRTTVSEAATGTRRPSGPAGSGQRCWTEVPPLPEAWRTRITPPLRAGLEMPPCRRCHVTPGPKPHTQSCLRLAGIRSR